MKKEEKFLSVALVGNPNCGKTTLFNLLTKSGEAVGNRAGVTFAPKKEKMRAFGNRRAEIIDLPGIYSLSAESGEERAALRILRGHRPDLILNIVDAGNLKRGLFLTLSLLELGIPTVLALNMMDEAEKEGIRIDTRALAQYLGIPVFPISAAKNIGIATLVEGCFSAAGSLPKHAFPAQTAKERFAEIEKIVAKTVVFSSCMRKKQDIADRLLCHPSIGIPFFFLVMFVIFSLTFSGPGEYLTHLLDILFIRISEALRDILWHWDVADVLIRFLIDGIFLGVSSVVAFLPQTAILFCLLALLEDSGYMARAAFVTDRVMRSFGLSGKAVIPFLIGFGCSVPAVMTAETLEDGEKESVIFSLSFIPCNARLPVLLFLVSSFFDSHIALIATGFYVLSVFTAFLSALLYTGIRNDRIRPPLVIELPKYRFPQARNLAREVKNKLRDFLIRAGTVVFLSCAVIHALGMLTPKFRLAASGSESILALLGNAIAPIFSFLGFGNGNIVSALATGFFAKESIISTLHILLPDGISSVLTAPGAVSLTAFSMLYTPCAATLSAARRSLGRKKAFFLCFRSLFFAAVVSWVLYTLTYLFLNYC